MKDFVQKKLVWYGGGVFFVLTLFMLLFAFIATPPADFPIGGVVSIPKNATLTDITDILDRTSIIRSKDIFKLIVLMQGGVNSGMAGDYLFTLPTNAWTVARRITHGDQGIDRAKVTFPEGVTVKEMATILAREMKDTVPVGQPFDTAGFIKLALPLEGFLFPDTYFFFSNAQPQEVVETMQAEFKQKIATIKSEVSRSKRNIEDIINMASIVEKEAATLEDRRIVAGILWKRLDDGMPLQVDPPFAYVTGKSLPDITSADLKKDSPYNTYLHKGLPISPIGNPGLDAILATVTPTATPYWFYISGKDGTMHYAKNYSIHLANIDKYLR